jgi:hypothetical protein
MDFGGLPPDQRAAGYRELARNHMRIAGACESTGLRVSHLELASLWTRLADEAERQASAPARDLTDTAQQPDDRG